MRAAYELFRDGGDTKEVRLDIWDRSSMEDLPVL
jgi:hypothetical protein